MSDPQHGRAPGTLTNAEIPEGWQPVPLEQWLAAMVEGCHADGFNFTAVRFADGLLCPVRYRGATPTDDELRDAYRQFAGVVHYELMRERVLEPGKEGDQ